MRSIVALNTKL